MEITIEVEEVGPSRFRAKIETRNGDVTAMVSRGPFASKAEASEWARAKIERHRQCFENVSRP